MLHAGAARYGAGLQVVLMFKPSPNLHIGARMGNPQLLEPPDYRVATEETLRLQKELQKSGRKTLLLGANAECPDGCYTKDPGTSFGWNGSGSPLYLQYPMGPRHRKEEVAGFRDVLRNVLGIEPIQIRNEAEGGDVSALTLPDGSHHVFVGVRRDMYRRTSMRGAAEIRDAVGSGWNLHVVPFNSLHDKYLHLDSGANFIGFLEGKPTWLIDPDAYPETPFRDAGFEVLHVANGERGVSAYLANGTLFVPKAKGRTVRKLRRLGLRVKSVAFVHHERADAGVPCITNTITLPPNWKMMPIEEASSGVGS